LTKSYFDNFIVKPERFRSWHAEVCCGILSKKSNRLAKAVRRYLYKIRHLMMTIADRKTTRIAHVCWLYVQAWLSTFSPVTRRAVTRRYFQKTVVNGRPWATMTVSDRKQKDAKPTTTYTGLELNALALRRGRTLDFRARHITLSERSGPNRAEETGRCLFRVATNC